MSLASRDRFTWIAPCVAGHDETIIRHLPHPHPAVLEAAARVEAEPDKALVGAPLPLTGTVFMGIGEDERHGAEQFKLHGQ